MTTAVSLAAPPGTATAITRRFAITAMTMTTAGIVVVVDLNTADLSNMNDTSGLHYCI